MRRLQEYHVTFTGKSGVYRIGDELLLQENILMKSTGSSRLRVELYNITP